MHELTGGLPLYASEIARQCRLTGAPVSTEAVPGTIRDWVRARVDQLGTVSAGALQIAFGVLGVGALMRFVPRTVMLGFVNALAILIFLAQVPHILLSDESSAVRNSQLAMNIGFIVVGLVVIYGLPRITKVVPSPLVAIALLATAAITMGWKIPTVGDMGALPDSLPFFALPDVPLTFETLQIILPFSLTLAFVGLLESLLTAQLLDDLSTRNDGLNQSVMVQFSNSFCELNQPWIGARQVVLRFT